MTEVSAPYKVQCPSCRQKWSTLEDFLSDPQQSFLGYQAHFRAMTCGFFLFNHIVCKTTMGLESGAFLHLTTSQVFSRCQRDTGACPQFCQHGDRMTSEVDLCECEFVRQIMCLVMNWPKTAALP